MASVRRMGAENSKTRADLIKAAAKMVRDGGYAALTARKLAEKVGLKRQIVHYYFHSIEDLIVAVAKYEFERFKKRLRRATESADSLGAALGLAADSAGLGFEFIALALRSNAIRVGIQRDLEEVRRLQTEAVAPDPKLGDVSLQIPPALMTYVLRCLAQSIAIETALGVSNPHAEVEAFVKDWRRAIANRNASPSQNRNVGLRTRRGRVEQSRLRLLEPKYGKLGRS